MTVTMDETTGAIDSEHPVDAGPVRRPRPRHVALVAVVSALVVGGSVIARHGDSDGVARARHLVQQDSRFANGPKAGAAFAAISHMLLDDATSCARHHGQADTRCQARASAAAYTTVSAFSLVSCTQPGVFRARRALLDELNGIVQVDHQGGRAAPPAVPPVTTC